MRVRQSGVHAGGGFAAETTDGVTPYTLQAHGVRFFGLRFSAFLRTSDFGLRISPPVPMKTESPPSPAPAAPTRLPLKGWALEMARRWNGGTYSLFILHGNIFDLFPVQDDGKLSYVPLKTFLVRRLFPERACLLFYDISDGLTFGSADMQKRFFEWLEVYDNVENTNFHASGPPRDLLHLAPLLRRFFLRVAEEKEKWRGITLVIDFPEKLI